MRKTPHTQNRNLLQDVDTDRFKIQRSEMGHSKMKLILSLLLALISHIYADFCRSFSPLADKPTGENRGTHHRGTAAIGSTGYVNLMVAVSELLT